jgi:hypothetical protein
MVSTASVAGKEAPRASADGASGGPACHRCGAHVDARERLGRRDACLRCGAALHCCRNCDFFAPGRHNDCREPLAERQVDKEAANFCEYFRVAAAPATPREARTGARAQLEALFRKGR